MFEGSAGKHNNHQLPLVCIHNYVVLDRGAMLELL